MDQLTSLETYSLMARCLTGEAVHDDKARLNDLLASHPHLKTEYEHLRVLFPEPKDTVLHAQTAHLQIQKKLEHLHRRLREEGAV